MKVTCLIIFCRMNGLMHYMCWKFYLLKKVYKTYSTWTTGNGDYIFQTCLRIWCQTVGFKLIELYKQPQEHTALKLHTSCILPKNTCAPKILICIDYAKPCVHLTWNAPVSSCDTVWFNCFLFLASCFQWSTVSAFAWYNFVSLYCDCFVAACLT